MGVPYLVFRRRHVVTGEVLSQMHVLTFTDAGSCVAKMEEIRQDSDLVLVDWGYAPLKQYLGGGPGGADRWREHDLQTILAHAGYRGAVERRATELRS